MLEQIRQLVRETAELTDSSPPDLIAPDAAVLTDAAVDPQRSDDFYIIGMIGGKNVGKSSLVNALTGREISAQTSIGIGTDRAIAYVHESRAESVRRLLEQEVPGRFELIAHAIPELSRQVLLDLPDIDSHFSDHVQITRRMLRHMLYPLWIQSVEKYADSKPRQLLLEVTAGNDPANMVFCLNKIDQVLSSEGPQAVEALRQEYAQRLAEALHIAPPRVWMLSTAGSNLGDLPALRQMFAQEKSTDLVARAQGLATHKQAGSLLHWIDRQQLPNRLAALQALQQAVEEAVVSQVGGPLLERVGEQLLEDRHLHALLAEEAMHRRVDRWPIVNVLNVLLEPVLSVVRRRLWLGSGPSSAVPAALVAEHLNAGVPVRDLLSNTFAHLRLSYPQLGMLYAHNRLWESEPADRAAAALLHQLTECLERQRNHWAGLYRGGGPLGFLFRFLFTVGAALWFPIIQPMLEAYLKTGGITDLAVWSVQLFSAHHLLYSCSFLLIYFTALWLLLKWTVRRRVSRRLRHLKSHPTVTPELNPLAQTLQWLEGLPSPCRQAQAQLAELQNRIRQVYARLSTPAPVTQS